MKKFKIAERYKDLKKLNILIIPDGNRRWATQRGRTFGYGYEQMPRVINKTINGLLKLGIKKLYFWGNSIKNLERPKEQITSFWGKYLKIYDQSNLKKKLRIHILGNKDLLFGDFKEKFKKLEEKTKHNQGFDLYLFLNYSTMDDLSRAYEKSKEKGFSRLLKNLDEPDNLHLVIRTGGDKRLSGFMPLKSPNVHIYFIKEFFPELSTKKIESIIWTFLNVDLRYGLDQKQAWKN